MSYPYSQRYSPPIPAIEIALSIPESDAFIGPLFAVLDTGADASIVPQEYLKKVGAVIVDEANLRSYWGDSQRVYIYQVDLRVNGQLIPDVEVVSDERGQDILLGRDVLNQLCLLLDGPTESLEVLDERVK